MNYDLLKDVDFSKGNEEVAKEYLKNFYGGFDFNSIEQLNISNNNISLVSDDNSMEFLTKRLSLISDTGIISHRTGNKFIFLDHKHYEESVAFDSGDSQLDYVSVYGDIPSLENLGNWLRKCKELILTNTMLYLPRIKEEHYHEVRGYSGTGGPIKRLYEPVVDAIIKNKKLVGVKTKNTIKSKYIKSIVELNIPIIDNVDLELFSKVTSDERSQIDVLRNCLRELFLEIEKKEGTELFYTQFEKISLRINKEMKNIENDFKTLKRKRAFQISGYSIASIVATLIAVDSNLFEAIGEIVGTSGGLYLFLETLKDGKLSRERIKQNPFYYFWYLDSKVEKI